jgi:hypothetical protein
MMGISMYLDKSPGDLGSASNPTTRTDFPTNVPCVSDDSMGTYMNYLYMQEPINGLYGNATITGVPVSLDAVDPNGNSVHIATVTSDGISGTFGYTWAPTIPGQYKITATFAGGNSYGSSSATTYAAVTQATAATTTPTTTAAANVVNTADIMTFMAIGIIAVIIAIGIVGALILRKKS